MKRRIAALILALTALLLSSCSTGADISDINGKEDTDMQIEMTNGAGATSLTLAKKGEKSKFLLSYDTEADRDYLGDIEYLREALCELTGAEFGAASADYTDGKDKNEILIGSERAEAKQLRSLLGEDEFGIRAYPHGESYTVVLAYTSARARMCGIQYLLNCCGEDGIVIDSGKTVKEKGSIDAIFSYMDVELIEDKRVLDNLIIHETVATMRDPNAIYHGGYYYLYGTGWVCYRSTSLEGPWEKIEIIKHSDLDAYGIKTASVKNPWAPEIHKYNGKFYLFTTYACGAHDCDHKVKENMKGYWQVPSGHRASIVLVSDSPEGPFVPISRNAEGEPGHSTPDDLYTIDATLYVDREGQPWMVYSKEWMTVDAPKGSFLAARLSEDLSSFISESVLVFEATLSPEDGSWVSDGCMDGEFFYRAEDGTLYMLWSPSVDGGYSVAVARSESGELSGPWVAESELLYSKEMGDGADGGHGSLFTDENGQLWLLIHSPNGGAPARPTFIPIIEKDGRLVWGMKAPK